MLVLSRRKNESIDVVTPSGETIVINIAAISGNRVSVGVSAARSIRVVRSELNEPLRQEPTHAS